MKMENILRAEKSGTVKSVNAKAGDSLAVDAIILENVVMTLEDVQAVDHLARIRADEIARSRAGAG